MIAFYLHNKTEIRLWSSSHPYMRSFSCIQGKWKENEPLNRWKQPITKQKFISFHNTYSNGYLSQQELLKFLLLL